MKFIAAISRLALAATAIVASPTPTLERGASHIDSALEKRSTTFCDSYGSETAGQYTFYHNNWGASYATSGSQCTTFNDLESNTASWSTSWTWAGGSSNVKSYSNVAVVDVNKQLSSISTINSIWKWSYTGTDIVADVSYDLWLAGSSGGTNEYEIMVWLAAYGGAGPISSTGSAIATATIGSYTFNLYSGTNGDTTVYSFVATSTVTSFTGDLNLFFQYLINNEGISSSLYITSLQAGTEPFTGTNAVMTTSSYTLSVRT